MVATDVEQIPCRYDCGQSFNPKGLAVHEVSCIKNPDRRPHSRSAEYRDWALSNGRADPTTERGDTINTVVAAVRSLPPGDVTPRQVHAALPDLPMSRVSYGLRFGAERGLIGNPRRGVYTATVKTVVELSQESVLAMIQQHYGIGHEFAISDLYDKMGQPGPRHNLANRMLTLRNLGFVDNPHRGFYRLVNPNGSRNGSNGSVPERPSNDVVVERPTVRDVRARMATNQRVGTMLATLVNIEPEEASLLIEWIDLTRELVGRGK